MEKKNCCADCNHLRIINCCYYVCDLDFEAVNAYSDSCSHFKSECDVTEEDT